jgi:hypothetical protein
MVGKHGSNYIDYYSSAIICPECQGTNVCKIGDNESDRNGEYFCKDCGCEFDTWISTELTKAGKIVSKILNALCIIFCVLAILSLCGGLIYMMYLDKIYQDGSWPQNLEVKAKFVTILGPVICIMITAVIANIEEKI